MGQKFSHAQLAKLKQDFAEAGDGTIPGSYLTDGSVTNAKLAGGITFSKTLAGEFATGAQGTLADSATQPGDNVSDLTNDAGYLTTTTVPKFQKEVLDAAGGEVSMTLSSTPVTGSDVQVFYKAAADTYPRLWREGAGNDYTISGAVITFVSVTPLAAGDEVHVYYQA